MSGPHPPVVFVTWVDTASVSADWEDREDVVKDSAKYLEPISAAGFLLAQGPDRLVLALLYNDHADHVGHAIVLPMHAVVRIQHLLEGDRFALEQLP